MDISSKYGLLDSDGLERAKKFLDNQKSYLQDCKLQFVRNFSLY